MVRKTLFSIFITAALLSGISLFMLPSIVSSNSFKPDIESALSDALGIPVQITGTIGYTLWPDSQVFMKGINVDNDLAFLQAVEIGINLQGLFRGEDYIDSIKIIGPDISLIRLKNGEFNLSKSSEKTTDDESGDSTSFALDKIIITEGAIVYSDQINETVTEVTGLHMEVNDLLFDTAERQSILEALTFRGNGYAEKINSPFVDLSDLSFQVSAAEGQYHIQPFIMTVFNGKAMGDVQLDLAGTTPHVSMNASVTKFYLEEFSGEISDREFILGESDFIINVSLQGKSIDEAIRTAKGSFSLLGDNLMVKQYDIDRILKNYRKSQKFGALDIGAFFLAGPLGTAVTKGYNFEEVYRQAGKEDGTIQKFISKWKIEEGSIIAEDVAFCTGKNRMALKGKLDIINNSFDNVVAAVIDEKGCAEFTQKIYGSFDNPQFGKATIFKSLAGAFLSLFSKTGKFISGKECKTFYSGSVAHPSDDV